MRNFKQFPIWALLLLITACHSGQPEVFSDKSGAIHGYDPVSYFKEGKAVKGKEDITYSWKGAVWHFSSIENRELFKQGPEQFSPQYGGYCAYGTAEGHKAPTEPDAFTIQDGKLFLNYNKDVQVLWNKDRDGFIRKADSNWTRLRDE